MNRNPFMAGAVSLSDDGLRGSAHVSVSVRVYEEIRSRIISLELPPETTLQRADLAERFGVSQSPLREALLRLEQDGLVKSFPQSRTVVTKLDATRIREEHFLRTAVECEVVRQLAERKDAELLRKAKGFLKMQEALVDDVEQAVLFKQLDEAFHGALFGAVNQSALHQQITARCGHLARLRTLDLPRTAKMRSVLDGHQAVIDAIETGDGDHAASVMRRHLSGTMERLPQIMRENEALFA